MLQGMKFQNICIDNYCDCERRRERRVAWTHECDKKGSETCMKNELAVNQANDGWKCSFVGQANGEAKKKWSAVHSGRMERKRQNQT